MVTYLEAACISTFLIDEFITSPFLLLLFAVSE